MRHYKILAGILLLSLTTGIWAQEYAGSWKYNDLLEQWEFKKGILEEPQQIVKWNSLLEQWDIEDSQGKAVGIIEWNPLYKRYDYRYYPKPSTPSYTPSTPSYIPSSPSSGINPLAEAMTPAIDQFLKSKSETFAEMYQIMSIYMAGKRQNPTMYRVRSPNPNRYKFRRPGKENAIRILGKRKRKQAIKELGILAGGVISVVVLCAYVF